jgi:hypothetical protein
MPTQTTTVGWEACPSGVVAVTDAESMLSSYLIPDIEFRYSKLEEGKQFKVHHGIENRNRWRGQTVVGQS